MRGPDVRYFDIRDQAELREFALQHGLDGSGCPIIDYVSPTADLGMVKDRFDAVFSSHVIEHQVDLVGHLRAVAELLRPGGAYYLIIPDKRYCIDHFRPLSNVEDVRQAEGRKFATEESVADAYLNVAHNNPALHWFGLHGRVSRDPAGLQRELARLETGGFADVHNWMFVPSSFRSIAEAVEMQTGLRVDRVYDTGFLSVEFMAVLTGVTR